MNETLVYDAARDASAFTIMNIATVCMIAGLALMSVPIVMMIRRQPEKRTRGFVVLGAMAALVVAVVFGSRALDSYTTSLAKPEIIEGNIGSVTPSLITVGIMKVMVRCGGSAGCPGVAVGDRVRVAFVDDSGPETDALATQIWKRPR